MSISSTTFEYNTAYKSTSLGTISDAIYLNVSNSVFKYNKAQTESNCINIMQTTYAYFDECTFLGN